MLGAFFVGYLLLDWISYIHPMQSFNITPWNPQPALAIALLMYLGQRSFLAVLAAVVAAECLVRGAPIIAVGTWLGSAVLSLGYAAIAATFTGKFKISPRLDAREDMIRLLGGVAVGTLLTGLVYLGALAAAGLGPTGHYAEALVRFWVGNSVGILVTLPMVLMLTDTQRRRQVASVLLRRETIAQGAAITLALWLVFAWGGTEHFKLFYLLFLPLIWVAIRAGMVGATLAGMAIQAGVILAVVFGAYQSLGVFELQALLMALVITGFFLGVAIDERERATNELRQTMRLAAAGEMAAALAHELNQPLTALLTYAKASQLLAEPSAGSRTALIETLGKLGVEARRAADVVQRLRDFFRTGALQFRPTVLADLVAKVLASIRARGIAADIVLECSTDGRAASAVIDPAQMEIVLRNLVMNGIDAVTDVVDGPKLVKVAIFQETDGRVRIEVQDTGAGVSVKQAGRFGEPFVTTKASGMGMGLAISRSIVEAHGGEMWVEPGSAGRVCLTLPAGGTIDERE